MISLVTNIISSFYCTCQEQCNGFTVRYCAWFITSKYASTLFIIGLVAEFLMAKIRYLFYLYLKKEQETQAPCEKACFCETKSSFAAVLDHGSTLFRGDPENIAITTGDLSFKGVIKNTSGALAAHR